MSVTAATPPNFRLRKVITLSALAFIFGMSGYLLGLSDGSSRSTATINIDCEPSHVT